jgi:hypothetical protein
MRDHRMVDGRHGDGRDHRHRRSGLDTTTNEFTGRVAASTDVAGSRGLINADSDHGTAVAMVAAAARNNNGVMGIAYGATIAAFRADTPEAAPAVRAAPLPIPT